MSDSLRPYGLQPTRLLHPWDSPGKSTGVGCHCQLNNKSDSIQLWHTPFPILNQSGVPCLVLTVASWPAYRFLKRQVRLSGIPISFRIFHSLLWSTQSCLENPMDGGAWRATIHRVAKSRIWLKLLSTHVPILHVISETLATHGLKWSFDVLFASC